ncbi:migration and invasion enhancer 1 [Brachionus plicatilis]|uniref:Migration and invasion enhancer 1 n=1 Tax=Brachionus plicatilis TaxID=10195 RepID=A0A3M7Q9L8_BRAPC|nr:migration and invasion enhancer 1 [Brachionus plicatilis]
MKKINVLIEYCFASRFREVQRAIFKQVPDAIVIGNVGRWSSFEVTVNGKLIYSMLETGEFPNRDLIATEVVKIANENE